MANANNKVYVNPNFNSANKCQMQKNKITLHVNPKFSQQIPQSISRIYVNPNFVKTNNSNKDLHQDLDLAIDKMKFEATSNVAIQTNTKLNTSAKPNAISQSRYSLVRHNGSTGTVNDNINTSKTTTIKINKYKSVALNKYKKNWNRTKAEENSPIPVLHEKSQNLEYRHPIFNKPSMSTIQKHFTNKYKLFRSVSSLKSLNKSSAHNKSNYKVRTSRCSKINNIPCPLYKKYGKCLRKLNGNCDFLHDKKHVAICRKFVKGVCHEKNCLLSHDVTSKKMPTCYFYLKGLCTKDDCPYLHVKLNEKTKLCPDFLKGYCEKGDLCLNRHVHDSPNTTKFNKVNKKQLLNSSKQHKSKSNTAYKFKKDTETKKCTDKQIIKNKTPTDYRYYEEVSINEESVEVNKVIKPSRCKLGSLPSYIKL